MIIPYLPHFAFRPGTVRPSRRFVWVAVGLLAGMVLGCNRIEPTPPDIDAPTLSLENQTRMLQSNDSRLQMAAIENLTKMGAKAQGAIEDLEKLQDSANPGVREAARAALETIRAAVSSGDR